MTARELTGLSEVFRDFLRALVDEKAEFLLVGGHAVGFHGHVRSTLDMDVLVRPTLENSARVFAALRSFGAPLGAHDVTAADFARPGMVYQLGLPPRRIDVLTSIAGVSFDEAWADHEESNTAGFLVPVISRDALVRNKRAAGRPKDLVDARELSQPDRKARPARRRPSK